MSWHLTIQLDTVPTLQYMPMNPGCLLGPVLQFPGSVHCTAISWIRTAHMTQGCLTDPGHLP
jgi:hypothetical protein